jgi:hypothetical protein
MTGHIRLIRPAGAAIAAVLALQSTPMIAQVIVPPPVSPAPAAADAVAMPTPAAPPVEFKPAAPVVQQTMPVEERIAAATAAAEAESAQRTAETPASVARVQPKSNARPMAVSDSVSAPGARQELAPAVPTRAAPTPANVAPPSTAAAEAAPAVTSPSDPETQQSLLWALGGGALVLLGLGGAALARRRRTSDRQEIYTASDAAVREPAMADAPAVLAPAYVAQRRAPTADGGETTLEQMVAAPPSADNPFTTRSKRMRRAKFLLARQAEAHAPEPHMPPQTTHAEPTFSASPDRSQTVYRFGADSGRQGFLKPRTR